MQKQTLFLMLGYPGSGKTTTAKVIHQLTGAEHLWADLVRRDMFGTPKYTHTENIQLYEHMNNLAETLLTEGKSVIFDTNFNFYKDRQRLRNMASEHVSDCYVMWVTTPKEIAKERATKNATGQPTRVLGDIPTATFDRMSNNLQKPRDNEQVIEVDGTRVTENYIKKLLEENNITA
jgi:predicted kinase